MKRNLIFFGIFFLIFSDLIGQGIPYYQEFLVNNEPAIPLPIIGISDDKFVVCWAIYSENPDGWDIFGQIFSASWLKGGDKFKVNNNKTNSIFSSIAGLNDGGFVICWENEKQENSVVNIYGQRFDTFGTKKGNEFRVNNNIENAYNPCIIGMKKGGFIVCWSSSTQQDFRVYCQLFDELGQKIGDELQVNADTNLEQNYPFVASLNDGGFVICWLKLHDINHIGGVHDIYCQIFDDTGAKKGNEFQVNFIEASGWAPGIIGLIDGGFIICYKNKGDIYGQIFDATGIQKSERFLVNSNIQGVKQTLAITKLSDERFVICWDSESAPGDSGFDIYGQFFDAYGNKSGTEFSVNVNKNGDQRFPHIAGLQNDGFVACWEGGLQYDPDWGIFGICFVPVIHYLKNYLLIAPLNDATFSTTNLMFSWQRPSSIHEFFPWEIIFDLYIDTDSNFPHPQIIKNLQDTTCTIDSLERDKTYFWKVLAKNLTGDSLWSKQQDWGFFIKPGATLVEDADNEMPQSFELFQNYPNPFNSITEIKYSLAAGKANYQVQLNIYDTLGRLVKVLVDQSQSRGTYVLNWNATNWNNHSVASGLYFYVLQVGDYRVTKKMLLLQ